MNVLLSIRPQFAELIFEGAKRYEYRRRPFGDGARVKVFLYVTRPVAMIVGELEVDRIVSGTPETVWQRTGKVGGIAEERFFKYFRGKARAYAMRIKSARRYAKPVDPYAEFEGFRAPRSFAYLSDEELPKALK